MSVPLMLSISIVFSGHIGGKQFAIWRTIHRSAEADPKSPFFRNLVSLGSNAEYHNAEYQGNQIGEESSLVQKPLELSNVHKISP